MPDLSARIKRSVGESSYATWLANASIRIDRPNHQECEVTISVAEQPVADRIGVHLYDRILKACETEYQPAIVTLNVEVDPKLEPCGLSQFRNKSEPPKPTPTPREKRVKAQRNRLDEEAEYRARQIKAKYEEANVILDAVCEYMRIPKSEVCSRRRPRRLATARAFCAHFLYRDVLMSYPEIATFFKRSTHSTIIDSVRRVDTYLAADAMKVPGFLDPITGRPVTGREIVREIRGLMNQKDNTTQVTTKEARALCFRHGLNRVVILQFRGTRVEQVGYARTGPVPMITEWT